MVHRSEQLNLVERTRIACAMTANAHALGVTKPIDAARATSPRCFLGLGLCASDLAGQQLLESGSVSTDKRLERSRSLWLERLEACFPTLPNDEGMKT